MGLIDADELKEPYEWWEERTEKYTLDEMKRVLDTLIDLQPTIEKEEKVKKMTPITINNSITSNVRNLECITTGDPGAVFAYNNFIKTYSEPEGAKKAEEPTKKEPIIDHKFLEGFERIMKKDITMREKAAELVDKVLVHGVALIVFWKDGSKTVVKCTNEEFDLEKGVAMALIKRMFGNKGNYNAFLNFIINSWTY